ncbi:uncharacterized protein L3040_006331 [Drepanopeziza brunnea f. sp. 'multigermtubi']|uniref:uncharacterized protein n=1 Tax=Drepanopeziza brunnea f. sp. 'multigermtubi' TaxID=698441 RepID=UPI00238FF115|nr:hypothetical protein L3040_006331 [Drepanopeziza brunnea f. sp. 'multigermtubi']
MKDEEMTTQEQQLCEFLKTQPRVHNNRYNETAENALLQALFWSMACGRPEYLNLFFPDNTRPLPNATWKLRRAQGNSDGDEFTEAARGKACGHIFKAGEATYRCKSCSQDDTCVLCSRCYDSSDHEDHMVYVSVSLGNSGCCDCGDPEAWRQPVHCSIHTAYPADAPSKGKEKAPVLPADLVEAIRMTIGRVFDYICDVISCSPEQLRLPKSEQTVLLDEKMSRLTSRYYSGDLVEEPCEFALLLWNDEKHTVNEVRDQVSRACRVTGAEGMKRANETDDVGRSIVKYSFNVDELLSVSKVIEQIKVTVTIRSARDTFREQMCGTIIEWLSDIAGCSVGSDHNILRQVICEEMLKKWSTGSEASNKDVGMQGIDDHQKEEESHALRMYPGGAAWRAVALAAQDADSDSTEDEDEDDQEEPDIEIQDEDDEDDEGDDEDASDSDRFMGIFAEDNQLVEAEAQRATGTLVFGGPRRDADGDVDMNASEGALDGENSPMEESEATMAGYPPPPPPPPAPRRLMRDRDVTPSDSDTAEMQPLISHSLYAKSNLLIPKTPGAHRTLNLPQPPRYWLETPPAFSDRESVPLHEDLWHRLRLDWMILFDLRMWKKVRTDLRDLYISTVVSIPEFKRVLGLRFAGLYTTLAQLYLIADREPDHSIINISLQMLTTPTITAEIVERGNFFTNLMAILYTFLTTRQVGHPHEINPNATLSFDSGSVTNRRMYHFFQDLRYLFESKHVQEKLRTDDRYMMQFLDLVKLHQGICPNLRAVGEHVEYETDAWISASLITREINRLCRHFSEFFKWNVGEDKTYISKAIRLAAKTVILNSLGTERKRFLQAEIKDEIKFKKVGDYEFDTTEISNSVVQHSVVKFVVESQPISFHHALHYTLSWLIESGKNMSREELTQLLTFTTADLVQKPKAMGQRLMPSQSYTPEDHLMAAFDYPLRVCAWLAQMKAGLWVRNGMSLRHQMGTYRGVGQRDVSHHRDIFLLQTAMVVCPPSRVLVSIIDRYGLEHWMKGIYEQRGDGLEDGHVLDIVEDLIHLLIVLISDRTSLTSSDTHVLAMRRDITHVLCFKPLSFSEICSKLPDKFQDQEECQTILDEMTIFKAPEGLSDVGTFELKPEYLEDIDPYIAHYNKNQREESEMAYKNSMSKKTGIPASEIVFEPKLRPVESRAFADLSAFSRTGIFAQIIYYALLYPLRSQDFTPSVPVTRVEAFLQVVLHLVLIAIAEDQTDEEEMSEESLESFIYIALNTPARSNFLPHAPASKTIAAILEILSRKEEFKSCHSKITLVLKRMKQKRPRHFEASFARLGVSIDRISTASPAVSNVLEEREKKKQAALARQAKVMAQFQQQQKNFLDNQGDIDWDEDEASNDSLEEEEETGSDHKTYWQYPSGKCILCQEECKEPRLYGTFALFMNSTILRQTDFEDPDFMREVTKVPENLDRSAESIRPFGVAGENRTEVRKVTASGVEITAERQFIGKGFPSSSVRPGPVSSGCGHIMHYQCFENFYDASARRHTHQIARHHPENLTLNEFVCPLCKALGNAFLPIIWSPKENISLASFKPKKDFEEWILNLPEKNTTARVSGIDLPPHNAYSRASTVFMNNNVAHLPSTLSSKAMQVFNPPTYVPMPGSYRGIGFPNRGTATPVPIAREMQELTKIYDRLRETMLKNGLPSVHKASCPPDDGASLAALGFTDTLAESLGYSISSVEIQQRGVATDVGMTFIETIPQQALTHLRILSDTAATYVSIGGLKLQGENAVHREFCADYERQFLQLFLRHATPTTEDLSASLSDLSRAGQTLLDQDIFVFLTQCSFCLALVDSIDIINLVQLCYLAELAKVALKLTRHSGWFKFQGLIATQPNSPGDQYHDFKNFCSALQDWKFEDDRSHTTALDQECFNDIQSLYEFMKRYALVFLRKSAILLHVRHGAAFQDFVSTNPNADELTRLSEAMHLPSYDKMLSLVYSSRNLNELVYGWTHHTGRLDYPSTITVSHPGIFELIGLPKNYDTLMEETMKRRCPTTGKDVSDPMLCLFCGVITCGQSICCLKPGRPIPIGTRGNMRSVDIGGAQQHMYKCQKNIGLFINIRKCTVYYLHRLSGSWMVAPYIDKYGEVDPGLRHNRQLFLNQKRYDVLLRTSWLSHGVPSVISRKLEMDINNGGWETI